MSKKNYWRFRTKAEMSSSTLASCWNEDGLMDYLFGTFLPEEYEPFADEGCDFKLTNTNPDLSVSHSWIITPGLHLVKESVGVVAGVEPTGSLTDSLLKGGANSKAVAQPVFDIDRLAKEIDELFQIELKNKTEKLLDFSDAVSNNTLADIKNAADVEVNNYKTEVEKIFPAIKDRLLDEIRKGRTVIVMPDATEITVEHMDHPVLEEVMQAMLQQKKSMLVGPAGTGKTFMVGQVADRLKLPFYKYSCSRDSSVHDLLGYKQPKSETYLETAFLNAYENGGVFLVDEYDAMSGDMALFFNGIADSSKFISIPHRDTKPQAIKHKDFYLVMCGNTWGKGSTDYSGRDFQDMALMDRFRFCRFHVGYHTELEKDLMGPNYSYAVKLRKGLEDLGSYLSTRNIEDISNLILSGVPFDSITNRVTQDLTEEERSRIQTTMKKSNDEALIPAAKDKIIMYNGNPISLEDMIKRYPTSDPARIQKLKKSSPKLYEEYRYALASINITI